MGSLQGFVRGMDLSDIEGHVNEGVDLSRKTSQKTSELNLLSLLRLIQFLKKGELADDGESRDEESFLFAGADVTVSFVYYFIESISMILRFNYSGALNCINKAIRYRHGVFGQHIHLYAYFLYCFAVLRAGNVSLLSRTKFKFYLSKIESWDKLSGHWSHRIDLLKAMYSWRVGDKKKADLFFNRAVEFAVNKNFYFDAYLIMHEMAEFKMTISADLDAFYLVKKSIVQLREWGASGLAEVYDKEHRAVTDGDELLSELQQTRAMLLHSEKMNALGRMGGAFIHEVNNPLHCSIQALSFVSSKVTDPVAKEGIKDALEGMNRIKLIIQNLKAFAFSDKGEGIKDVVPLNVPIDKAISILRSQLVGIDVKKEIELADIYANETHLVQVFMNLIINSMYAIKKLNTQGKIKICAVRKDDCAEITIQDNGGGLSNPKMIFNAYYTGKGVEGVGLGLSIVKQIVDDHDGTIYARNADSGALFIINIPLIVGGGGYDD